MGLLTFTKDNTKVTHKHVNSNIGVEAIVAIGLVVCYSHCDRSVAADCVPFSTSQHKLSRPFHISSSLLKRNVRAAVG